MSSLWGSKYLHVFSLKVLNGDQMFCVSFGVLCGDLTFLNGTFWNSVWGIRILECFKKFFIGAEDAWRFQELFMENSKNFWTFFGVVCQNQTFWMLNVFLEFLLGVRISDLSFWSSLWGSKFLHAFSRRVLCGDQNFLLSFGIPCGDLNFWMMCGGLGSKSLNVFSSFYGSESSWMFG